MVVKKQNVMAGLTPDKGETKLLHGPALRYVGALINSSELYNADGSSKEVGNYNFEEEYLLGDNKVTVRQYDADKNQYRERIEYRREFQENGYYYVEYYETDMRPDDYCDVTRSGNMITIDLHIKSDYKTEQKVDTTIELYYKDKEGFSSLISTKTISRKINNNFRDSIIETIAQQMIDNK